MRPAPVAVGVSRATSGRALSSARHRNRADSTSPRGEGTRGPGSPPSASSRPSKGHPVDGARPLGSSRGLCRSLCPARPPRGQRLARGRVTGTVSWSRSPEGRGPSPAVAVRAACPPSDHPVPCHARRACRAPGSRPERRGTEGPPVPVPCEQWPSPCVRVSRVN